jgi:hypothetical protein
VWGATLPNARKVCISELDERPALAEGARACREKERAMPSKPRIHDAITKPVAVPAPPLPEVARTRVATATSATSGWAMRLQALLESTPASQDKPHPWRPRT